MACRTKRRFKATTDSKHDLPIAPNDSNRQFAVNQANQVYVGYIAYIPTLEGWLYLAVVIDLFSLQVVGWAMAAHMNNQLVNDELLMALWKRKPNKGLLCMAYRSGQPVCLVKPSGTSQTTWRLAKHEPEWQMPYFKNRIGLPSILPFSKRCQAGNI